MYIVIGGSGFLGRYVIKNILNLTSEKIIGTYTKNLPQVKDNRLQWLKFDAQQADDIQRLNTISDNNSKVIYLASYSSPDFCEKNQKSSWDLNVTALANFVNTYTKAKCLYYASTDVVYGESFQHTKFKENANLNPVNIYGVQKALAERIIMAKNYNVFRLPLMMGPSLIEGKKHFFDKIYESLDTANPIDMFVDSYRSILSFNQCAKLLINLIEIYGSADKKIINFASDQAISKYELALKIAEKYGFEKNLIKPISIKDSEGIFVAKRAKITEMDNSLLKSLLKLQSINLDFDKIDKEVLR